jgi:hypothetical protein
MTDPWAEKRHASQCGDPAGHRSWRIGCDLPHLRLHECAQGGIGQFAVRIDGPSICFDAEVEETVDQREAPPLGSDHDSVLQIGDGDAFPPALNVAKEASPLAASDIEKMVALLMRDLMRANDAPPEAFARIGLA